jgi:hypothetical protein
MALDLDRLVSTVRRASMVPDEALILSWQRMLELIDGNVPGAVIECGTWMGGCSFGMALAQRQLYGRVLRPVMMLDSFEGLPPATERDGVAALQYQSNPNAPGYYNNCRAPIDQVLDFQAEYGLNDEECPMIPGWFNDTVPPLAHKLAGQGIALLRVDCDWYEPVRLVLEKLGPLVSPGGIVILDDYYMWDGCARATHDYLAANDLPYRLRELGHEPFGAWFTKPWP